MKRDLKSKQDVELMVDSFYEKVNQDELLSPIFNKIVRVDWDKHLPKMYNFWETIIFHRGDYKGSPFDAHIPLPVGEKHFGRWVEVFKANLDEHFEGEMTEHIKMRATSIALTFQAKMKHMGRLMD